MTDRLTLIEDRLRALEDETETLRAEVDELRSLRDYVQDRVDETLVAMRDVRAYQNHVARTMSRKMAMTLQRVNVLQRDQIDATETLNNLDAAIKNLAMAQMALAQSAKGESESKLMELPPIKTNSGNMN